MKWLFSWKHVMFFPRDEHRKPHLHDRRRCRGMVSLLAFAFCFHQSVHRIWTIWSVVMGYPGQTNHVRGYSQCGPLQMIGWRGNFKLFSHFTGGCKQHLIHGPTWSTQPLLALDHPPNRRHQYVNLRVIFVRKGNKPTQISPSWIFVALTDHPEKFLALI